VTANAWESDGDVVAHARGGQMVEEWEYFDTGTFLAQISATA
jgi:hypothetical protein